jgi:C-terminal processing protease CtpA/Prc
MQFVSNTEALIIDLRNNRGGDGDTAASVLGYFFKSKTKVGRSFSRLENKWTDEHVAGRADFTKGLVLNMPVYVLTSGRTFSAAEWFAYSLQTLRDGVVVGEPSNGSAHLTRSFSMGHGFVGFIPHTRFENAKTGTDWEGKGVVPDVGCDEGESLAAAQIQILEKRRADVSDPKEQRKLTWIINSHKAKRSGIAIEPAETSRYLGRFAEFEVALKDGQLTFTDTNQPKRTPLLLVPVTTTLFQAGGDYQVEFLGENDGAYRAINVFWADGWVEEIPRTNP